MGEEIYKSEFTDSDYEAFGARLEEQLEVLRDTLRTPAFNRDKPSIGAELEVYLVDGAGDPAPVNEALLELSGHPQLTPELNRYNLEFNLSPVDAKGTPFGKMDAELRGFLDELAAQARGLDIRVVPVGILPTLREEHLSLAYMTDRPRYHVLNRAIVRERGEGVPIRINGKDPLSMRGEGVTVEGANTSFQLHLRLAADDFARSFNAAQLTTPLVLALSANSPMVAGHRLWQESRIALFKQSTDIRLKAHPDWRQPARVSFGHGWVREGAWELFAENVALHAPLVPVLYDRDDSTVPPSLRELRLHHGTIWPWNRAVYDTADDGHLRIEFRALPAGPTVLDMMANAALAIGWSVALQDRIDGLVARLPFRIAEYNFYRAAQHGLDAILLWPCAHGGGLEERPVTELIASFLPCAADGLAALGVDSSDADPLLDVAAKRLASRQNGAQWQLDHYERYREKGSVREACRQMLAGYMDRMTLGDPVATWS
ncbi:MAG: glutamate-cysteine ligase family protein [Nannocystales bacterium]